MRRSLLAFAVALPLVVLALGMYRAERHLGENRRWSFEVTGYDPRDLLRGHYLQYRIVLEEVDPPSRRELETCDDDSDDRCCLCLTGDDPEATTSTQRTSCEAALQHCDAALRSSAIAEMQRYYIPEARADEITKLFQDARSEHRARLVITVDESANPHVDTLLVDDIPIERAR